MPFRFIPPFISHNFQTPKNTTVPRARGSSNTKTAYRTLPYRQVPRVCRPPSQQSQVFSPSAAPPGGDITARSMGGPRSSWPLPSVFSPRIYLPSHCCLPRSLTLIHSDLAFAFASTTSSRLSSHSHKLLLFAPFVEGILGGQTVLQTAISAYISDCTSDGSRAYIFSRFAGVSYFGFTLGPALGAFLIRHPLPQIQSFGQQNREMHSVAAAFWAAIFFSTVNLILSLVIPESLDKVKQRAAQKAGAPVPPMQNKSSLKERLLPLTVFAPRKAVVNGRMREDWSMLWLASAVFLLYLAGVRNYTALKLLKSNTFLTGRVPNQIFIRRTRIRLECRTGVYF